MLKVAFVSNYFNHHQSSFSEAMFRRKDTVYTFIETMPMEAERKRMGWGAEDRPPYVLSAYESEFTRSKALDILRKADLVIAGMDMALDPYLKERRKEKGFVFCCSERFYKNGCPAWQIPLRAVKNYWRFGRFQNEYLLCASAFSAADAAITRSFVGKTYRWGYFPETKRYDLDALFARKRSNQVVSLLWVGRLLPLKHPDDAVLVAAYLKEQGLSFRLRIIGSGEMEATLRQMIQEKDLADHVELLGSMTPEAVRAHMDRADLFLFNSDHREGWGAVLNESMNSACAVVASHAIGSVPFLIRDGKNGRVYRSGDLSQLCQLVSDLVLDRDTRERLGAAAYHCIVNEWNAETAAERLVALYEDLRVSGSSARFSDGPCSPAPILPNEWYMK